MRPAAKDARLTSIIRTIISSLLVIIVSAPAGYASCIRIGLVRNFHNATSVSFNSPCGVNVRDEANNKLLAFLPAQTELVLDIKDGHISCTSGAGKECCTAGALVFAPIEMDGVFTVSRPGGRRVTYRGSLIARMCGDKLLLINEVELEDYLLGVVPAEMPESFGSEALKAQAVAARTYTLANLHKKAKHGYNLCDTTSCQVYKGKTGEKPNATLAVAATKGEVLTYHGVPAQVMYHGDSGGATHNYTDLRPKSNFPYLCGAVDPPEVYHTKWEEKLSLADIAEALGEDVKSIIVSKTGRTGRVLEVSVQTANGTKTVTAGVLQRSLGVNRIRSTLFTIESLDSRTVVFRGKGYGHGVGMCQTGAKGLSQEPHNYTYAQILTHYFPGTSVTRYGQEEKNKTPAVGQVAKAPEKKTVIKTGKKKEAVKDDKDDKQRLTLDVRIDACDGL